MQIPINFQKYLSKQNLQKWNIELGGIKHFNNVIVIPALNEFEYIPKLFRSLSQNSKKYLTDTLILVVVNNTGGEKENIVCDNKKLLKYLREVQYNRQFPINVGVIDASSKGKELPEKAGGVGLARKIGMDLSLNYFDYEKNKKKIIISLDADCTVSNNYLEEIINVFNNNNYHTAIVNFEHTLPKNDLEKAAIINYEIFIRYYVLGLKYAESPYAYYSIGSTIVCDAESYIKIGGMNNRKAGEDFYFLEKMAKINEIYKIKNAAVFPSSRISSRVPFGTGKRVQRFIQQTQDEYLLYSPNSFEILKQWLDIYYQKKESPVLSKIWVDRSLQIAKEINTALYKFLIKQNFAENWIRILSNSKTSSQIEKQKHYWMDGFRTLKLLHYLRDNNYGMINTFEAINTLIKKMEIDINFKSVVEIPNLEIQFEYLKKLRELT